MAARYTAHVLPPSTPVPMQAVAQQQKCHQREQDNAPKGCHLCAVGKVAKLGLPQDQGVGVLQGVAQLEAQDAKLGQGAVADGELAVLLAAEHVCQRRV